MLKRVVVIASGDTERRSIPHLLQHLWGEDIDVHVRIPPRNRGLNGDEAYKIIQAVQYDSAEGPPDKYVVLLDVDGKTVDEALCPVKVRLSSMLPADFVPHVQYAYAKWHLEAWYFADATHLREYLDGRALGHVDTSSPDDIQNPKLHLKHLLGHSFYTARIAEEIAQSIDASIVAQRSPSFRGFLEKVRNGSPSVH